MLLMLFAALVWFFVNRASVRANEQIRLLNALLEEQRTQTALIKSLVPSSALAQVSGENPSVNATDTPVLTTELSPEFDGFNVIPER